MSRPVASGLLVASFALMSAAPAPAAPPPVSLTERAQLAGLPGTTHLNIIQRGAWLEPLIKARLEAG